jgi:MSHA biogenesis protein MshL
MRSAAFCLLLMLCTSCGTLLPATPGGPKFGPAEAEKQAVHDRLKEATRLFHKDNLGAAQEMLDPIMGSPYFRQEITLLANGIAQRRAFVSRQKATLDSADYAIGEVEERAVLPKTYGQSVTVHPEIDPLSIPVGSMEALYTKRVDLNVFGADVRTIVMALSEIDGLNIIADEALNSAQTIDVSVKQVPLGELLAYIAANLGIAFHLGENMIWVTAAQQQATGPKLETKIYRLKHGYLAANQAGGGGDDGGGGGGGSFGVQGGGGNRGGGRQASQGRGQINIERTAQDDLLMALGEFLEDNPDNPADAKFQIYRTQGLLMVRNLRQNIRLAEEVMRAFDVVPPQVLIEARFITISRSDLFQLGISVTDIQYEELDENNIPRLRLGGDGNTLPFDSDAGGNPARLSVAGLLDEVTYSAVLEAIERARSARTLSAPRITVINNQSATIRKGTTQFYFDEFEGVAGNTTNNNLLGGGGGGGGGVSAIPSGQATQLDTGIRLDVTPSVGNDLRAVILAVDAEVSEFVGFETFEVGGSNNGGVLGGSTQQVARLPIIDESLITTIAAVNSGETVVLGGTLENQYSESTSKVPLLGDVPLVGNFFKRYDDMEEPAHLLIFLTATVVDRDGRFNLSEPVEVENVPVRQVIGPESYRAPNIVPPLGGGQ